MIEKLGKFNWTINSNNWLFSAGLIVSLLIYYVLYGIASIFSVESLIFAIASVIGPFFIIFYFIMCITKAMMKCKMKQIINISSKHGRN